MVEAAQVIQQSGIIVWCNQNTGFVSAVLSLLTILLSIIATVVSIRTARLPYKKSMQLKCGRAYNGCGYGIYITAINTGNRPITISMMGLEVEEKQLIIPNELKRSQCKVLSADHVSQHFLLADVRNILINAEFNKDSPVFAYVEDIEGERYRHRICLVRDILSG